jgi:conjugal transfer pilus assembly protein TraK
MIPSRKRNRLRVALALAMCLRSLTATAVQIVDGADGTTIYAKVSKKEMTRLALEHGRISSLRVKDGELGVDPDEETGQLFLSVPHGAAKPINGFLTTDTGATYTLILQVVDAPSDSIIIRQAASKSTQRPNDFKSTSYDKAVKRMIAVMATDELPADMQITEVGRQVDLWKEASMSLERQYIAGDIVGERYVVGNVSKEPMVLDEREFFRTGVGVVAIEQLNLAPGGSTRVYLIREKNSND